MAGQRGLATTGRSAHEQSQKLERLCRYIARPAISEKRLSLSPQGAIGTGDGLAAVASAPLDLGLSDLLINILSGAVLDHVAGGGLDPLIDEHLWGGLIDPILSIAPLIDPIKPVVSLSVNPLTIDLGQSTLISASATDNQGVISLLVTAAGQAVRTGSLKKSRRYPMAYKQTA